MKEWTLETALAQIAYCNFACEGGPLQNNVAWQGIVAAVEGGALMRAALENIASQKTCDELASEGDGLEEEADFVGAYDTIILIARRALSHPNTGDGK